MTSPSKTVLVKSPNGRNFKVEFSKIESETDFASFKEAFFKICQKDEDLSSLVRNDEYHLLSFRKFDDLFNCHVEITDFEEIQHGSVIELFITTSAVINLPLEYQINNDSDKFSNTETSELNESTSSNLSSRDTNNFSGSQPSSSNEYISEQKKTEKPLERNKRRLRPPGLVYPCELPKFSAPVKKLIEEGTIDQNYGQFVRECAAFLLTLVEEPTRSDYDVFCRTLANQYNFINVTNIAASTPYAFFKKTLTCSIRNARYYNKRVKPNRRGDVRIIIDAEKVQDAENDTEIIMHNEEIIRSLKKKNVDSIHITELMKKTAISRRKNIVSSKLKIADIQTQYPALKFQEWIVFDFSYETKTSLEERKTNFLDSVVCLKKMKNENFDDDDDDMNQLQLFKWVEKKISSTKNVESCMLMLKVGDAIVTSCSDTQAPHVIIYTRENGKIAASVILGEGSVICQMAETDVFSIFDTLLAVYFTFDYEYPKAYSSFLYFLQSFLLKNSLKGQKVTSAFVRFMKEFSKYQ